MIKVFDSYLNKYFSGEYFLKKAEGRRQKVPFRRGFNTVLNGSHQIFNLVGVLNPYSRVIVAENKGQYSFCPLPFLIISIRTTRTRDFSNLARIQRRSQ
jgi:hypothetical protein